MMFIRAKPPLVEAVTHHTPLQPFIATGLSDSTIPDNCSRVNFHSANSVLLIRETHLARAAEGESPESCPMYVPPLYSRIKVYRICSVNSIILSLSANESQISGYARVDH